MPRVIVSAEGFSEDRLPLIEHGHPLQVHVTEPVSVVVKLAGLSRFELAPESAPEDVVARLRENGFLWHPILGWWKPIKASAAPF